MGSARVIDDSTVESSASHDDGGGLDVGFDSVENTGVTWRRTGPPPMLLGFLLHRTQGAGGVLFVILRVIAESGSRAVSRARRIHPCRRASP
jgi:hypothetical protein